MNFGANRATPSEEQLSFALHFGRDAARVLYPTIHWAEACRLLAKIWPEKRQQHDWALVESTVRAGWNEVVRNVENMRRI